MARIRVTFLQLCAIVDNTNPDAVLIDIEDIPSDAPQEEGNIRVIIDGQLPQNQIIIDTDGNIK